MSLLLLKDSRAAGGSAKYSSHSLDEEEHPLVDNVEGAIRHMLTWTEHVLQGFQELRWKLIG